jgi:RNA polymerase sigma-70 factor (ECF subfamily)
LQVKSRYLQALLFALRADRTRFHIVEPPPSLAGLSRWRAQEYLAMPTEKDLIHQELLILRCRRGERAALEELVKTWERRIFYFVRRLGCKEQDAWDVVQQTWLKVLRGLSGLKEPRNLAPWLYRIARNTAINHGQMGSLYRENLHDLEPAGEVEDPGPHQLEDAEQIHHGLLQLALPHREVLTLHFLESMTVEQIGLAGGVVFALAWTALAAWTLRKGTWYGKIQPTAAAVLGWVFAVFLETLFLVLAPYAPDPYLWTVAILAGLVILVGAGFQLVGTRIQQSELRLRESFLRMEYRLAELAEQIAQNQQK